MDSTVKVWDVGTGQERATLKGHTDAVSSVALSGDGKTLVSGSVDGTVRVWDVGTGQERATLKGHTAAVLSVALSGDGKTLVSGSDDGQSRSGTWARGRNAPPSRDIRPGRSVALSGDGKTLVSGSYDNTVKVWDVGTGQERATLKGHKAWSLPWR